MKIFIVQMYSPLNGLSVEFQTKDEDSAYKYATELAAKRGGIIDYDEGANEAIITEEFIIKQRLDTYGTVDNEEGELFAINSIDIDI